MFGRQERISRRLINGRLDTIDRLLSLGMIAGESRARATRPNSVLNSVTTSVGRFYEKRHQFTGALQQYSKALSTNPDDTAIYIDRSRILLKLGSIGKAQEDTGRVDL